MEVGCYGGSGNVLPLPSVLQFVEDIEVQVSSVVGSVLLVVGIGTVVLIGRYSSARVVGVVDGVHLRVSFLGEVSAEVEREVEFLGECQVELSVGGVAAMIVAFHHVVLVSIPHRGIVAHFGRSA